MVKLKIQKDIGFLLMYVYILVMAYLIPYTLVLAKEGLRDPTVSYTLNLFVSIMYGGLIALPVIYLVNKLWKQDDKFNKNLGIFSKEHTIFRNFTYPQIFLFFTIIFMILFFTANLFNAQSLIEVKVLPQSFSNVDSLAFSTLLTPTAENLLFSLLLGSLLLSLRIIAVRFNFTPKDYSVTSYILVIFGSALFGVLWHISHYAGSDVQLMTVAIFWGLMGLMAIGTGFFLVPLLFHQANNFFIDFNRLVVATTFIQTSVIVAITLLIALYLYLYRGNLLPFGNSEK